MAKKKTIKHVSTNSLAGAVTTAVNAKYRPQFAALAQLLHQAAMDYSGARGQNNAAAQSIQAAMNQAVPAVLADQQRIQGYQKALLDTVRPNVDMSGPYGKAIANQAQVQAQNLGLTGDAVANILRQGAANAVASAAYQNSQLRGDYLANKQKILGQLTELASESGDYGAKVLQDLYNAQKNNQTKVKVAKIGANSRQSIADQNNQTRRDIANQNNATRKEIAQQKAAQQAQQKKQKDMWASPEAQQKVSDSIQSAIEQAKRLKQSGYGRHEAASLLLTGRSPSTVKDGNNTLKVPGIPKTPQLIASIALDMSYDGHVSRRNVDRLHKALRTQVKNTGLPTHAPTKPKPPSIYGITGSGQVAVG